MNDQDLLDAVRRDFGSVQLDVPAETILAGGRSRRRRRRAARGLALTAVAAAGLGLGVAALVAPSGTPPAAAGRATLAAWTVTRQPDGTIGVTLRELTNITGLQQRLNELGVPVAVHSHVRTLPGCLDFKGNDNVLINEKLVTNSVPFGPGGVYFVIHPAPIPRGDTLEIAVNPPGWPPATPAPHQRFPPGQGVGIGGTGFGGPNVPEINGTLVYTGSNCS